MFAFNIQIEQSLVENIDFHSSDGDDKKVKIDQMYFYIFFKVIFHLLVSSKNLYLRRSQNNAYNHDGLVDSDAVSLSLLLEKKTFLSFSLSLAHSCSLSFSVCVSKEQPYFAGKCVYFPFVYLSFGASAIIL